MPRTFQQVLTRTFTSSLVAGVLFAASTHGMPKLAQANQPAIVAPASLAYAPNLPASIGKPYLSEVSPAGSAAWVEIALEHTSVYLPLVQRGADAALDKADRKSVV